jgi:prepilin-type N-terminal cleavage/methylation domain-containing protein
MKKGFTLIELLVAIAIITVLSLVVLASLSSACCKQDPSKEGCPKVQEATHQSAR